MSATQVQAKAARHAASMARSTHGFVATPDALAEEMCGWPYALLGSLGDGAMVLEPSAGDGALVRWILDANPDVRVYAVEPEPERAIQITALPGDVTVEQCPFEESRLNTGHLDWQFDAVVMNPPWSTPGQPRLWIDHILLAYNLLRPGGRLVAVTPDIDPAGRGAGKRLRELVAAHGGHERATVDQAAVRAGFPSRVRLMWLARPLDRDGLPSYLLYPAAGEPVEVANPDPGPSGPPVQAYRDRWWGDRLRVMRLAGTCCMCRRLLWCHDDQVEGAVEWEANSVLEAEEFDLAGPPVGLCMECANTREDREAALALARNHWAATTDGGTTP